jgi:hypothetical protein
MMTYVALHGGKWSDSRPGRFTLPIWEETWWAPEPVSTLWRGKSCPCRESNPGRQVHSYMKWIIPVLKCILRSVGIETGYGLDDRKIRSSSPGRAKNFFFSNSSRPALGPTQPPSMGTGGSFPRVKQPEREADHSLPTSTEVKKMWIYTATSPYAFMHSA